MSFATVSNIATTLLCLAVLVQSVRMMRSLKAVKEGALTDVVGALDKSTAEARVVLGELKAALVHCAGNGRVLDNSRAIADELRLMIDIANATAERLVEAASPTRDADAEPREVAA
jgi:hypothetical protein